jgi:hypothetical protein
MTARTGKDAASRRALAGRRGSRARTAFAAALVFLLFAGCAIEGERQLVVSDGAGRKLAVLDLPDGRFSHVFRHSFHLTPVEERMEVEGDGTIRLFELRYESCGVGMPTEVEEGFRLEDGVFVLSMSREFKSIPVMISPLPGHGVVVDGVFHPFTDWAQAGQQLVLTGRTRARLHASRR